jgi:hypothetical protein
MNPPPKNPHDDTIVRDNDTFLRELIERVFANMQIRSLGRCYGDVVVTITYNAGKIMSARINEESTMKPKTKG